jgi:hypothetical protein
MEMVLESPALLELVALLVHKAQQVLLAQLAQQVQVESLAQMAQQA